MRDVAIPIGDDAATMRCGAIAYLAWLAYPAARADRLARRRWFSAVLSLPERSTGRHLPKAWSDVQLSRTDHLGQIAGRGARRIWHRRIPAMWLAQARLGGQDAEGLGALEAYQHLADHLPAEFGLRDADAVKRLCWRESRPALALAWGAATFLLTKPGHLGPTGAMWHLCYADPRWVPKAMAEAERILPLLATTLDIPDLLRPVPHTEVAAAIRE